MQYVDMCQGLRMPLVGLGTFSIPNDTLMGVLKFAVANGVSLFDTAYKYQNESVLGSTLHGENVIVESKINAAYLRGSARKLWMNRHSVRQAFFKSSSRMGRPADVYLIHSPFPGFEKYFLQLVELKTKGFVKAMGVCNTSLLELKKLYAATGFHPDIVQVEVHPYYANNEVIDYCHSYGIVVEARSPFAHGDAMKEWMSLDVFKNLSEKYDKSIPQIILRWIVQQGIVALPRSTNVKHIMENIDIFDFSVTGAEMESISRLNKNKSYGFISNQKKQ